MKFIPWLLVIALAIGLGAVYSTVQKQSAELAQLRSQNLDLEAQHEEDAKKTAAAADPAELAQLRQEHAELIRLRGQAQALRSEKQQLTKQVQSAEAQAAGAQAQAQTAQEQAEALRRNMPKPGQPMTPEAEAAFRARYGLVAATPEQAQLNACINNLRQLDGAKQQWALENKKTAADVPSEADVTPYLKAFPTCPSGGTYTLHEVGAMPTCSVPGHALSQ